MDIPQTATMQLTYTVGNPDYGKGRTILSIDQEGALKFSNTSPKGDRSGTKTLSAEDREAFWNTISGLGLCEFKSAVTEAVPGDEVVTLQYAGSGENCDVEMWYSERYKHEAFGKLVDLMEGFEDGFKESGN
ncbi:MAG: hypothetical protein AAF570_15705 [Bacteroidota bacterium]